MKKNSFLLLALALCQPVFAQVAPFTYRLGALPVKEDAHRISIATRPPLNIRILPGGHTWPLLSLDEQGNVYAGDRAVTAWPSPEASPAPRQGIDESTLALPRGYRVTALAHAYRVVHGSTSCTLRPAQLGLADGKQPLEALKDGNVVFRASDRKLLALATWLGADNSETRYAIADIDLAACRVRTTKLGNPDLLVELNWSPGGGWWVTGSIEQTLLRSKDGLHWQPMALPGSVSSMTSAYIVDERDIWLAAGLPEQGENDPMIVRSTDGGKTWKNIPRGDRALARMPKGWLEGWRRTGTPLKH